jgi:probable rRNA maturation factor
VSAALTWDVEAPAGIDQTALLAAALAALEHGGRGGAWVEIVFVDDEALAALHERFLGDPSVTDVMAFDLGEDVEGPAGEVYVSVDCARRVASLRGVSIQRELALYVIHGCLHLCDHDDHEEGERVRMREAESMLLARLGYAEDSAPHEFGAG